MCTSPIRIRNKKKNFNPDSDPVYYVVPCGKCEECQAAMRSAWSVRNYYEWRNCVDHGGIAIYVTFTYNNDCLPHCDLPTKDGDYVNVPCFNKSDIQKFIDRFRKDLKRNHGTEVRYLITSEYGGNTHRPHYHGILYFNKRLSTRLIKSLIRQHWYFGFISLGDHDGVVNSPNALSYVAKYITKDWEFNRILDEIGFNKKNIDEDLVKSYRRQLFPFHLQSQGYGEAINTYNDYSLLYQGKCVAYDSNNNPVIINLPKYNVRKLFYVLDENKTYVPTDEGIKYLADKKKRDYEKVLTKFTSSIKSYSDLVAYVFNDKDIAKISTNIGYSMTRDELKAKIDHIFDLGVDKFFNYISNKRYYVRVSDNKGFHSNNKISAVERLEQRFNGTNDSSLKELSTFGSDEFQKVYDKTYSKTSKFEEFAILMDILRDYVGLIKNAKYEEAAKQEQINKKLIKL